MSAPHLWLQLRIDPRFDTAPRGGHAAVTRSKNSLLPISLSLGLNPKARLLTYFNGNSAVRNLQLDAHHHRVVASIVRACEDLFENLKVSVNAHPAR